MRSNPPAISIDRPFPSLMDRAEPALSSAHLETSDYTFADTSRLTLALRKGDNDAYTWLHSQWSSRIARYCFAIAAGDDAFAGEIAQAVWLRIVRHMRVLKDEAALWNWIARAARNAASDLRRTGGRYHRALQRFTETWAPTPIAEEDQADSLYRALETALTQLDPTERALIEARYFSTDTLEIIAVRHDLSIRAVEGRLARLRKRLRQLIADTLSPSSP